MPRYLKGMAMRLRKLLNAGLARDTQVMEQISPLWDRYKRRAEEFRRLGRHDVNLIQYRWLIE